MENKLLIHADINLNVVDGATIWWSNIINVFIQGGIEIIYISNYKIKNGVLTEVLEYGSKSMNEVIKERTEFVFNVSINENKFSQIELDSLGHPILAENYIRLE